MKTVQDLENENDKMAIFLDFEMIKQYVKTNQDLIDAMTLYLNDNQKLEVMRQDYFKNVSQYVKKQIAKTIADEQVKSQIIQDILLLEEIFDKYNFVEFLLSGNDDNKSYVLNNYEILQKFDISKWDIKKIINSMSKEGKVKILQDKENVKQLGFESFDISDLIIELEDDKIKYELLNHYELDEFNKSQVIKSFSDENKKTIILEDKHRLGNRFVLEIISSFRTETIIDFINNQQEFLQEKNIKPYQLIKRMPNEKQIELVSQIQGIQILEDEKRRIFAALANETKKEINLQNIDEKYRNLLQMEVSEEFETAGKIIARLDGDLEQYKDLDELLIINPLTEVKNNEDKQRLLKLAEICPNLKIVDNLFMGTSTVKEYIEGEEWVSSILAGIQSEWTDVQKLAYIDTAIGKKISYAPDFDTEVEDTEGARALWKIITSGYGVCNGIAQVEQYLLARVGIEAERVSGKKHSFIKVKNIEIPTKNGIVRGDTLVDPTWNLTASRYGSRPQHFCKSYEELRKVDIDEKEIDHECHKNNQLEQSPTINMDTDTLREVYKSIGIAEKAGMFPIGKLVEQVTKIDESSDDMQTKINRKFAVLKKWCPEFATCQNSTIEVLKSTLFENNENFEFKRCIASRVYDREDPKKQAVLYVYMETEEIGRQFFYADKDAGEFITLSQEEFEAKFECYEADMRKIPGNKRPWETTEELVEKKENSSGEVVAKEGR